MEPKLGDLIEIKRVLYRHWALYSGNGYVIHIVHSGPFTARVEESLLEDVAGTDEYHVRNYLDEKYKPRDVAEILREARSMVGSVIHYDVLRNNCEHFVTNLRYGKPMSRQAIVGKIMCYTLPLIGDVACLFANFGSSTVSGSSGSSGSSRSSK